MDLMIDLEGLATGPDTTILTIAAQSFDPLGQGHSGQSYYARVTLESQEDRAIDQGTIDWWATQPAAPERGAAQGSRAERCPSVPWVHGRSVAGTCGAVGVAGWSWAGRRRRHDELGDVGAPAFPVLDGGWRARHCLRDRPGRVRL